MCLDWTKNGNFSIHLEPNSLYETQIIENACAVHYAPLYLKLRPIAHKENILWCFYFLLSCMISITHGNIVESRWYKEVGNMSMRQPERMLLGQR